ncbi:antA/AntB antirepressor family protein [Lichenihabitans sp. Uapishka_5]|uniref:antA/AntB antirepressor family protein n=1 Tax=Lichenihabitans sp. Uapishka_5 TaxID=3037302 RepID=UPI0029E7E79C|nr:antA/AntB antirepressor family protein [Lichenihabitans sp. Uapishka_5]MDX7953735.1 antA/AntB antirepressor family protein [Lichenihabitans sp. Uapishka_5]
MPESFAPLPPITKTAIGGRTIPTVDARKTHAYLGVGRDFSTWIKDRIASYGFVEGEDYVSFEDLSSPVSGSSKARDRVTTEYALTLDMAKELGMVDRSPRGRAIRRYFIRCERKAQQRAQKPLSAIAEDRALKRVREARLSLGIQAAQQVWRESGLAIPKGFELPEQPDLLDRASGQKH